MKKNKKSGNNNCKHRCSCCKPQCSCPKPRRPKPPRPCLPCPPDTTCNFRTCTVDGSCSGLLSCPSSPTGVIRTVGVGQTFPTIQAAINAANSGDQILVFPGNYPEQITIPVGKNNLFIVSQTPQAATITAPAGGTVGNNSLVTVLAQCTHINSFTITGPSTGLVNGIFVTGGGSAVIQNNLIRDISDNPLSGVQRGHAINVDIGSAQIIGNRITNYQKTGIRVNGVGSCSTVLNNIITGIGPTTLIAQNGIQISRGATAIVQSNTVTGNFYTPAGTESVGILLFEIVPEAPVCVSFNNLSNNEIGLGLFTTVGALIQGNNSSNNLLYGVQTSVDSISNVFIRNTALNNTTFDFLDESVGILSAMTSNLYLCNVCNNSSPTTICSSTGL